MKYTIISDSCCDLFPADLESDKIDFHVAPLTITVDNFELVDDENLDTADLVSKMAASKSAAKTACPSPESFAELMRSGDNVIVVTLSSKLSGTYASAMVAAEAVKKEFPDKKLFVLDSLLACAGQSHVVLKLKEMIENNDWSFDEVTVRIAKYAARTRVRFVLRDFTNLVKNGRMSKLLGRILATARIKLVCGDNGHGEIKKYSMALGYKKALTNLAEMPAKDLQAEKALQPDSTADIADMGITITHVQNEEDVSFIKKLLESRFGFKNIKVLLTRGISTIYAAYKGIAIAY